MQKLLSFIRNHHRDLLFFLLVIWNCSILFETTYIPTLDGGAHAYNAKIMGSLLFGDHELYSRYFEINPEPVPNWFTNALYILLNSFLSPSVAEKTILLIFFITFPLLFRTVADRLAEKKSYLIFLVFPLTHYVLLYYGFFNFSYGILFFLLAVSFWIKNTEKLTLGKLLVFALICLLTFFSHLFTFASLLIFLAVYETYLFFYNSFIAEKRKNVREQLKNTFLGGLKVIACTLIPLWLTWMYFNNRPSREKHYLGTKALNNMLTEEGIFRSFGTENCIGLFFFYLFAGLVIYQLLSKFRTAFKEKQPGLFFSRNDVFLFAAIVMLVFFYTRPDDDGYGGFISLRFSLFVYILAGIWLAGYKPDRTGETLATLMLVFGFYSFVNLKKSGIGMMNSELKKIDGVENYIHKGATVVPVYLANYNWLGTHFSNYLGARKEIIITENFEAANGYFPLRWRTGHMFVTLENISTEITDTRCEDFLSWLETYPTGPADYVFIFGRPADQPYYRMLVTGLKKNYKPVYFNQDISLYERDPNRAKLSPEQAREEELREIEVTIRTNAEWMKQIEQKAKKQHISIEEMVRRDAIYIFEKENKKEQ
jgi:hypothetical protein